MFSKFICRGQLEVIALGDAITRIPGFIGKVVGVHALPLFDTCTSFLRLRYVEKRLRFHPSSFGIARLGIYIVSTMQFLSDLYVIHERLAHKHHGLP